MGTPQFVKSFSKGQITVPKEVRDELGLGYDFWLKVHTDGRKIIAEPVDKGYDRDAYLKKLLAITGEGFDAEEIAKNRKEWEKELRSRQL